MDEAQLVRIYIPALIMLLRQSEAAKVSPLTRDEVVAIRDGAISMMVPLAVAKQIAVERGYDDMDPANVWEEWQARRATSAAAPDSRADK